MVECHLLFPYLVKADYYLYIFETTMFVLCGMQLLERHLNNQFVATQTYIIRQWGVISESLIMEIHSSVYI